MIRLAPDTMAELIASYCEHPSDWEQAARLSRALLLTGPVIFHGRAWASSREGGVWVGPDLAARCGIRGGRPESCDELLAQAYEHRPAATVPVPSWPGAECEPARSRHPRDGADLLI